MQELRQRVAISMRILAMQGCVKDILGHVSARIPESNEMFIRCRGGNERGLLYTDIQQIRRLDFEVKSGDIRDDYMVPLEVPIHGEIYKAIPDAQAVVHAHPYASVVCGIAGLELRPIFGAFDPPSLAIAARGIPVYPRSVLINRADLAAELIGAMSERDCCLMKGHGITVIGPSVEAAALLALRVESVAKMTLEVARLGRDVPVIAQEDMEAFRSVIEKGMRAAVPRGDEWIWAHYVHVLEESVGVPQDFDPE